MHAGLPKLSVPHLTVQDASVPPDGHPVVLHANGPLSPSLLHTGIQESTVPPALQPVLVQLGLPKMSGLPHSVVHELTVPLEKQKIDLHVEPEHPWHLPISGTQLFDTHV
jgi:hypothetical protein